MNPVDARLVAFLHWRRILVKHFHALFGNRNALSMNLFDVFVIALRVMIGLLSLAVQDIVNMLHDSQRRFMNDADMRDVFRMQT